MSGTVATGGYPGHATAMTNGSSLNALAFLTRQIIAGKAFAAMVTVKAVHGGGIGPVGTVDVQPMVNQVDGDGKQVPHGTIYTLPYFRMQGGACAIIIDPSPGDIGMAVVCDRDISIVKQTKAVSGPGSFRQHDWSDGCYFGGFLNGTPTDYVVIAAGSVSVFSSGTVNIASPALSHNGVNVGSSHVHSDPQGGNTGGPH